MQALKPHAYTAKEVCSWLSTLDGQISKEVMRANTVTSYSYPANGDTKLLVEAPYDELYIFYAIAMVDFYNREMTAYANDMEMFNDAMGNYRAEYMRAHTPEDSGGGWITV